MATYAIGDLQGCLFEFEQLLQAISYTSNDRLWLVGDLINRGPESAALLRRIYAMRDNCNIVLGNHDLHFLAIYFGNRSPQRSDTFDELLQGDDVATLAHWLRTLPLVHVDYDLGFCMAHAGIPHIWSLRQASDLAAEVQAQLSGPDYVNYFVNMYGNQPDVWRDDLVGMERWRVITNYFTRMRLIQADGVMDFAHKGRLEQAPPGWSAWFAFDNPKLDGLRLLFGHWAALDGDTGRADRIALDTGCVWGRQLTAMCLETGQLTAVEARVA